MISSSWRGKKQFMLVQKERGTLPVPTPSIEALVFMVALYLHKTVKGVKSEHDDTTL